ncbi:MAG: IS66 family transposase zinc-finger binding domain-containing protein, partial [Chloroflexota bacterium]|nr:IS66 family transposase zinc-finger binding domain-containing protein [Chloroflexota bacterium]
MTADEALTLRAENVALCAENLALRAQVSDLQAALTSAPDRATRLAARVVELEHLKTPPPGFVNPDKPKADPAHKKPRKKRAPLHNHARRYETPTAIRKQNLAHCPDCGNHLSGNAIARKRQVLDLPPPAPGALIEYHLIKGYCAHCAQYFEPQADL